MGLGVANNLSTMNQQEQLHGHRGLALPVAVFVAIPREALPMVEATGVDRCVRLDTNLRLDHVLTQDIVHVPTVCEIDFTT